MKCTWLVVVCLVGAAGLARASLLVNGNFNADGDANSQPDGWSSWTYGPTAFASYKNDPPADPFDEDGTPYVNAGNYGDWWSSGGGWYQVVPGTAGLTYTLSVDSATEDWDNAAGELRLIYLDSASSVIQQDVQNVADFQASKPWATYSATSTAPAGTTQVKVEFATWGARGAVLWDNASLVVPEPAGLALLAGVALALRRR